MPEAQGFSALQRAEIAEMADQELLRLRNRRFSALQRAEIAEIPRPQQSNPRCSPFQCSSTSRNC